MPDQSAFDLWLDDQPANLRSLLVAIRSAILEANPDFTEAKKWGVPNYWLPEVSRRTICMINVFKDQYVRVEYHNGATMPDPESRLEGTGKFLRHIKIRDEDPETMTAISQYVRLSEELARSNPDSLAR